MLHTEQFVKANWAVIAVNGNGFFYASVSYMYKKVQCKVRQAFFDYLDYKYLGPEIFVLVGQV